MSNFHILDCSKEQHQARVAFHIAVPDEDNAVGAGNGGPVRLRTAAAQFLEATASDVPGLDPAELASILAGEVYEVVKTISFKASLSNAAKKRKVEEKWSELNESIPGEIRNKLKFWGLSGDVS